MVRRSVLLLAGILCVLAPARGSADPIETTSTYVTIRPDTRLCPSPMCGGYWVKWVNRSTTRCHDGAYRPECYVARVDFAPSRLSPDQAAEAFREAAANRALLRGNIVSSSWGTTTLGTLSVSEAWLAGSTKPPKGTYFRVKDKGIVCITTPCFWLHESTLNSTLSTDLSSLDLSPAGASPDKVQAAYEALRTTSLLAVGSNVSIPNEGPAGMGLRLVASQFYLKMIPR